MYTQRITLTPAPGHSAEVISLLRAQAQSRRAAGVDVALTVSLGRPGSPAVVSIRLPTITAVEEFREKNRADTDFQAFQAKLGALLASPVSYELWETLEAPPTTRQPRFVQRVELVPLPGAAPQAAQLIRARIAHAASDGIGRGLAETVIGEPERLAVIILFDSLAQFESIRNRNRQDQSFGEFQAKLGQLLAGPPSTDVSEVVLSYELAPERELAGAARR